MQGAVAFPRLLHLEGQETASPPVTAEKFPNYFVWAAVCKADTDLSAWTASESFKSLNCLDFYIPTAVLVKDTYGSKATAPAGVRTRVAVIFSTWEQLQKDEIILE